METDSNLELIDTYYKIRKDTNRNETWLKIKCKSCENEFERVSNCYTKKKSIKSCPKCDNLLTVSYLHAIVSCVAMKVYNGVETEYDIGFVGENGGKSRYDLYIPKLNGKNTVIEFQSRFHDDRVDFDNKKKKFAIEKGYYYISLDHRSISVQEALVKLFGIEYGNYNVDDMDVSIFKKITFDLEIAQKLLNQNKSYKEIGRTLGVHYCHILRAVNNGLLLRPKNHAKTVRNIKSFVQLTMDGEFIKRYESSQDMSNSSEFNGLKVTVVKGKAVCQYGFAWVVEEDYINKNYTIPNITKSHCKKFAMIGDNFEIIKVYNSIAECCKDIQLVHSTYLKNVLLGERDSVKGFRFKFLTDIEIN